MISQTPFALVLTELRIVDVAQSGLHTQYSRCKVFVLAAHFFTISENNNDSGNTNDHNDDSINTNSHRAAAADRGAREGWTSAGVAAIGFGARARSFWSAGVPLISARLWKQRSQSSARLLWRHWLATSHWASTTEASRPPVPQPVPAPRAPSRACTLTRARTSTRARPKTKQSNTKQHNSSSNNHP